MEAVKVCKIVIGCSLSDAETFAKDNGCTARVTQEGSNILLDNITSDYDENRINLRIERGIVKHARVG